MKRRDALKLVPLSIAGLAAKADRAFAREVTLGYPESPRKGESLSGLYQRKIRDLLFWIRENQSENLLEAAYAMARTIEKGGTCWANWDLGHSTRYDVGPDRNGEPEILTQGFNAKKAKKGDFYLVNRGTIADDVKKGKNILVVGGPAPWSSDAKMSELIVRDTAMHRVRPVSDIWIETNVSTLGAVVKMPGMPAPTGPVSGIIGQVTMWMMLADACRILARDGKPVAVKGDEPKLSGKNVPWVNLNAPLMDNYFNTVMRQIEMIEAEMGNIRQIAKLATDSILAGGKVYGYSRNQMALCAEAQTRRGGLTLSRGLFDKDGKPSVYSGEPVKGSSKDLVIMGLFKPDDPVELKHLDAFRSMGMKVASIGTMMRNTKVPDGRIVPKETDVHAGRMCDSYGLFAIPGFERKVCPTSGALQLQIYWVTCMEIADEIIRRTGGNVPGAFYSAAIQDGSEHMHLMNEWWKERGY